MNRTPAVDGLPRPAAAPRPALAWRTVNVRVLIGLCVALLAFVARGADEPAAGVLILHSNQRPTPAQIVIEDTLRTVVPSEFARPVGIYSEYLDDEWASVEKYGAAEAQFLHDKYRDRNIRVIVADALPALQFATQFRGRIFTDVAVVHIAVARDRLERIALPAGVVGNTENHDPTPTLELALRLHPGTKQLVLIRGASDRDRQWETRFNTAVARLGLDDGFEVQYLTGLPSADLVKRVGALAQGAIVFAPGYFIDGAGQVTTPRQSVERIAQASPVPVYGAFDTFLGSGIVGGYMTRYEDQAKEAGAIIVRLLNGSAPTEIVPASVTRRLMVDWRQLQHWHIDERLLPAGTIVMFREPTTWEKYWHEISLGAGILLFQAGLIVALLLERRSRQRTANALAESQRQMNLATSAARLSLWIWDAAKKKLCTPGRSRRNGARPRQGSIAFDDVMASVHPLDRDSLRRAVATTIATGDELDTEYRVVDPDGRVRWIAARGRPEDDDPQRLQGVALDITERKAADLRASQDRTALRQMSRVSLVGQLSAAIAHQLNQPLAAILGNAEAAQKMLEHNDVDVAELREICKDIVGADHRATEIIKRLSELYKRGDMKIEPIDLNRLLRETLDLLRTELLIRHVVPAPDFAPKLPTIEGGFVQLQQVVLNLVINAADAMSGVDVAQRKLIIRTKNSGAEVLLYVIDNGTGIAPEHLKTVFEPFWTTKAGGMGMGLAICQSIVATHRGSITATNNADGGATFCVRFSTGSRVSQ
jgi:C4-dicarboxylate-specific signal transduction histidine kinase